MIELTGTNGCRILSGPWNLKALLHVGRTFSSEGPVNFGSFVVIGLESRGKGVLCPQELSKQCSGLRNCVGEESRYYREIIGYLSCLKP